MGRHPGPERAGLAAPVEGAEAVERDLEARMVDAAERGMDVAGQMTVDLADEAQRQVKLIVALPARAADPPIASSSNDRIGSGGRIATKRRRMPP